MKFVFPFPTPTDLCLPSTPLSLSRSLSCLPVFLVLFCFLSPPSLSVSQHVQACTGEHQGRGVLRGRTHVIISHSTADRWEELPGVEVQSQDTPSAVGKVSARLQHYSFVSRR